MFKASHEGLTISLAKLNITLFQGLRFPIKYDL